MHKLSKTMQTTDLLSNCLKQFWIFTRNCPQGCNKIVICLLFALRRIAKKVIPLFFAFRQIFSQKRKIGMCFFCARRAQKKNWGVFNKNTKENFARSAKKIKVFLIKTQRKFRAKRGMIFRCFLIKTQRKISREARKNLPEKLSRLNACFLCLLKITWFKPC